MIQFIPNDAAIDDRGGKRGTEIDILRKTLRIEHIGIYLKTLDDNVQ